MVFCNNINDPFPKLCVSDVAKNINVKMFHITPRPIETRHITCTCKCRLDASVCNNKQRLNTDKSSHMQRFY